MVLRIFRSTICRPSNFHKPNFCTSYMPKTTRSDLPEDEMAKRKEYQKIIDYTFGPPKLHDSENITPDVDKEDSARNLMENLKEKSFHSTHAVLGHAHKSTQEDEELPQQGAHRNLTDAKRNLSKQYLQETHRMDSENVSRQAPQIEESDIRGTAHNVAKEDLHLKPSSQDKFVVYQTCHLRTFSKTESTRPRITHKAYEERLQTPDPLTSRTNDSVQNEELRKLWEELQYELYNASLNRNELVLTCFGLRENTNVNVSDDNHASSDSLERYIERKRRETDAILQTYFELTALSTPHLRQQEAIKEKSAECININILYQRGEAKLNTTTANADENEKLAQKLETIEEVPLVEAEPDIIKPPKTTGPTVMNVSPRFDEALEEDSRHSDFQVYEEPGFYYRPTQKPAKQTNDIKTMDSKINDNKDNFEDKSNYALDYSESNKNAQNLEREKYHALQSNFNDVILNEVLPEVEERANRSLSELMQAVRQRNRLLRCHEIRTQLTSMAEIDRTPFPQSPMYHPQPHNPPGYMPPPRTVPLGPLPQPHKAEPIIPHNQPCPSCPKRTMTVSPANLALYLGPLISPIKGVSLFTLVINWFNVKDLATEWSSMTKLRDAAEMLKHLSDILSVYEPIEEDDLPVDVLERDL